MSHCKLSLMSCPLHSPLLHGVSVETLFSPVSRQIHQFDLHCCSVLPDFVQVSKCCLHLILAGEWFILKYRCHSRRSQSYVTTVYSAHSCSIIISFLAGREGVFLSSSVKFITSYWVDCCLPQAKRTKNRNTKKNNNYRFGVCKKKSCTFLFV